MNIAKPESLGKCVYPRDSQFLRANAILETDVVVSEINGHVTNASTKSEGRKDLYLYLATTSLGTMYQEHYLKELVN